MKLVSVVHNIFLLYQKLITSHPIVYYTIEFVQQKISKVHVLLLMI